MEAIMQSFIHAFGWSVLHSFWQGTVIYALLMVVLVALPKLSPAAKHNLSYFSLVAIFIWFIITFIQQWSSPALILNNHYSYSGSSIISQSTGSYTFSFLEKWFPSITIFYFTGFLLQAFILYKGYLAINKLRNRDLQEVSPEWQKILNKAITQLNITGKVAFHLSARAKVPMVIGYLKPLILFPVSMCTSLDASQAEAILLHELTHIKRNDYLLNQIKTLIETFLFFNPFIWLTGRLIKIEREHICDDMVLKYTHNPVTYAKTLLTIEMLKTTSNNTQAMALAGKKHDLLERIKRITTMKTNSMNLKHQLAGIVLIIFAIGALAWLNPLKDLKVEETNKNVLFQGSATHMPVPHYSSAGPLSWDTIILPKKKSEVKIMVTDTAGNKKEYNSINAIPDSVKNDLGIYPRGDFSFIGDSLILNGKDLSKILANTFQDSGFIKNYLEIAKQFHSPEFKKLQEGIVQQLYSPEFQEKQKNLIEKLSSPEIKKQQEEIFQKFNSPKFKEQQEKMMKKFNSPEFQKSQQELLKKQKELMEKFNSSEFKEQQEKMMKKFNSPEFQKSQKELHKKQEELIEKFNSPEFKKQQEKMMEKFNAPEFQKSQQELLKKQKELMEKFNSPEFKEQQEKMMKEFNSPEFQKSQQELLKKQKELLERFDSPEFKKYREEVRPSIHFLEDQGIQAEVLAGIN